jgi:hypothetical protein
MAVNTYIYIIQMTLAFLGRFSNQLNIGYSYIYINNTNGIGIADKPGTIQ